MAALTRRRFAGVVGAGIAGVALAGIDLDTAAAGSIPGVGLDRPPASGPQTWKVGVGVQSRDMAIQGMAFLPQEIWIDVGDTVTWTVQTEEFHTVTFLPPGEVQPPFNPADPNQAERQGGDHYDGQGYFNSGLLVQGQSYSLTFDVAGDFTYVCLVHTMMKGIVHVQPAGTAYPHSQRYYDAVAAVQRASLLQYGNSLLALGNVIGGRRVPGGVEVVAGIGGGPVDIMRFLPETVVVREGDVVTWVNLSSEAPHTVTFGPEPADPFPPIPGPPGATVDYDGSGTVNSGYIGVDPHWFGTTFRVRFTKAGTYPYICALHDEMGMVGTVKVLPGKR